MESETLLTTKELAARWKRSADALRQDRVREEGRRGPPFIKLGPGRNAPVRYRLADVLAYEQSRGIAANNDNEEPTP